MSNTDQTTKPEGGSHGSWIYNCLHCMQSVSITTDVVSSNLDQGEVYNITGADPGFQVRGGT
jgi:hypothetical protein